MSIFDELGAGAGQGLANIFKTVMDTIKLSPEAKAEVQEKMMANQTQLALMEADLEAKITDVAGQNIRAETQSSDKFTSRARPSYLYIMIAILGFNYIVFPLIGRPPVVFPDALFWLFGSCMLGYSGLRSWDKYNAIPDSPVQPAKK